MNRFEFTLNYGFIVASVTTNSIKQNAGLVSEMIKYTPVLCEGEEEIKIAFDKQFPAQTILMVMPIETLRKNIQHLDEIASKKSLVIA